MKWNVCPSQSYVVSNMRNEMKCRLSVSVIRGFQYEEWNEMLSVRLSYVVSNMRNEMKCLSVCHTWFPIWGMKWKCLSVSVIHGFQYEEWNEMLSVRLSYVVSNMRNEMKYLSVLVIRGFQFKEWNEMLSVRLSYVVSNMRNEMKCLSVCHTWFPIWGMKWNVCPSQSYMVSNMRNEMKCCPVRLSYVVSNMRNEMKWLSVCHSLFPIWEMKWNVVCPSVIRGFQYEEWKRKSVCHTLFPIWGMKWNVCPSVIYGFPIWGMKWNVCPSVCPSHSYVVSNMRNEMKCCLSVSVIRGFQYDEWNEMSVRLSYVVSNMRNEMKCLSECLSVSFIRGFQYEEWNEMLSVRLSHTWFPIWGMKWNVCPSVIRGFQYEEWNEMSVRLSHQWFPIWGMKWNVCLSVIRGFQYEEWNEMLSVRLSHTWFPIWGKKWNVCPSQSYVVSNMRNEMKCCLSVSVIRGFQYEEWNEMSETPQKVRLHSGCGPT